MVLPSRIGRAAQAGDVAAVEAWLDAGNDVNSCDSNGNNVLLNCVGTPGARTASHTDLVRLLIERGANVNTFGNADNGVFSALHYACFPIVHRSAEVASLLLDANANVHCRTRHSSDAYANDTALGRSLVHFCRSPVELFPTVLRIITMLLRAGASLDAVSDDKTAEEVLRAAAEAKPDLRGNDIFVQTKALIHAVRAAGSWKLYCRQDHKKILRLRSLVARGRATPKKWSPRGHDRRAIEFIVKIGDNGIAWKILSFWKET